MSTTLHTATGTFRIDQQGPADAPALLLSHSLGTSLEMWQAQAAALSSNWRVLRYDTRGHGGSVCSPGPYSIAQLGHDVLAILDALQIEQTHFCGISMGGLTGLWLGVHAPARLRSLTVANSASKIGAEAAWLERAAMVRTQGAAAMQTLAAASPSRWFTEHYVKLQPERVRTAQNWIAHTSPEGYASCCEALAAEDLRSAIAGITSATLLIASQHDPVTTQADALAMHTSIANSQLTSIAASHLSNLEAPDAFTHALATFLVQH